MQMIHVHLPRSEEDDRIGQFFELLGKLSTFTSAQVEFFRTQNNSIPDISDAGQLVRIRLPYETLLVLVYEPGLSSKVTEVIQTATKEIWPEREDIHAFEMSTGKPRALWSVRGGKK